MTSRQPSQETRGSSKRDLWDAVLTDLAREQAGGDFQWIAQLEVVSCSPQELVVRTPSDGPASLRTDLLHVLGDSFHRVCGGRPDIQVHAPADTGQLTLTYALTPTPVLERPALNEAFSFEHFVTGPSNRVAHGAAVAVATSPGEAYNPLYIHAAPGLGKTHLLHALCHRLLEIYPATPVALLSAETLASEYRSARDANDLDTFRARYRPVDVLAIDDLQGLPHDREIQEEFLYTFNALRDRGKQIIVCASGTPRELEALDERLVSRFRWGLVTQIEQPDHDMRIAILRHKAEQRGINLPDDVCLLLAEPPQASVRELEGLLLKLLGYASVLGRAPDAALVRDILNTGQEDRHLPKPVRIEDIQTTICRTYHLTAEELQSRSRTRSIAFPRQVGMYLARVLTKHSLEEIGTFFGGRDHSTVKHAFEKVRRLMDERSDLNQIVKTLRKKLLQR